MSEELKETVLNNQTLVSGAFGVLGMFVTGILSLFVAKNNNKKDQSVTDRQQLSADEQKFRDDLYERMKVLEDQVEKYMKLVDKYHYRSIALEEEVMQWKNKYVELDKEWRFKYTELEIENRHLQNKVFVLESHLKKMQTINEDIQ
jgi:predicted RNase H-like nuclease (RuvC/YqgF family)